MLTFTLYPARHASKKNSHIFSKGRVRNAAHTVKAERDLHRLCRDAVTKDMGDFLMFRPDPIDGPCIMDLVFVFKLSKEAIKAGCKAGDPRLEVPDVPNIMNLAYDAFEGVLYADDKQVCGGNVTKIWGERCSLHVTIKGWNDDR